jgi:hypothetical protein
MRARMIKARPIIARRIIALIIGREVSKIRESTI